MRSLYVLIGIVFITLSSIAQPYIPMINENHTWSVDIHYYTPGQPYYIITQQLTYEGETVMVNGLTYRRIRRANSSSACLVREENGRIYKYSTSLNAEILMYDFTLEIGDTMILPLFDYCYDGGGTGQIPITVVAVTTQNIAGQDRKVIEFDLSSMFGTEIWVEGIGSIRGFDPYGEDVDFVEGTNLVCFTITDNTYFFNGADSCDNTTLEVSENSSEKIVLYPNPVTASSILQLPEALGVNHIKIFDVNGKLVRDESINKPYFMIEMMRYRSGLYFYQVYNENALVQTGRFIIH